MSMKTQPNAPPLAVWGFVAVAFLVFYGIILATAPLLRMHVFNANALPYLAANKSTPEDYVVVAVGASMTRCAIDVREPFWCDVNARAERPIVLKRISLIGWLGWESVLFGNPAFVDALLTSQPDCILVEENLVGYQVDGGKKKGWLSNQHWQTALKEWLKHVVRPDRDPGDYFEGRWMNPRLPRTVKEDEREGLVRSRHQRTVKSRDDNTHFNRFLKQARDRGITVVMVNIPRPAPLETALHSGEKEVSFRDLITGYAEDFGLVYWRFPDPVEWSAYRDSGHMNGKGMALFTEWLADRLRELECGKVE